MDSLSPLTTVTNTAAALSSTLDHLSPSETYLKMEDVHHLASASASPDSLCDFNTATAVDSQTSPPPVVVQSRPAKKRKSWGQELPQPKTNLPPRKRAKTDDEKEQRRIERIKRNRAAAHNSRERKRQETETLAVALARANAELEAYRKLHGPLPASIILPEIHLDRSEDSSELSAATPAPSLIESHGSQADATSPASPADSIFYNTPTIKQEPVDAHTQPTFSPTFDSLDAKSSTSSSLLTLDLTQHSAAMLCDLQCRSSPMSSTTSPTSWWSNLFLCLMATQLQACYKTILVALWTLSPSRMARMMQASTLRSSTSMISSATTHLLRSTPRRLALPRAATGLRAPKRAGANALTRQSLDEFRRTSEERTARQAQTHQTQMALREHVTGRENHMMGDDGDENGVWRTDVS